MKNLQFLERIRVLVIITFVTIVMVRCGEKVEETENETRQLTQSNLELVEAKDDSAHTAVIEIPKETIKSKTFKIPKGVDRKLFVVAFYDELADYPMAIVYNNSRKKSATLMTFYKDGGISESKLVPESSRSFREIYDDYPEDRPHYVIHPSTVEFVHTSGSIGGTYPILEVE